MSDREMLMLLHGMLEMSKERGLTGEQVTAISTRIEKHLVENAPRSRPGSVACQGSR